MPADSAAPVAVEPAPEAVSEGLFGAPVEPAIEPAQPTGEAAPVETDAAGESDLPKGQTVNVGTFGQIDLHVKDLELSKVLQLLSIQSQRNIVASRNVSGSISADLYGVDFYEALDAILHTNGFGYREKGNFIYVHTTQEIEAMAKAEQKVVHKVRRLNYLNAKDASTYVTPLLSPAGAIALSGEPSQGFIPSTTDGGANTNADGDLLVIRDYPENVEQIMAVLTELDVRPKQVLVEATILEARLNEANAFGVDLNILIDYDNNIFANPLNQVDRLIAGNSGPPTNNPLYSTYGDGAAVSSNVANLAGDSTFKFGVIGENISAFIRALDRVTDTTIVARPKLLVLNRQRAELLVGAKLGYLSSTSTETATTQTVEFLEVGTQLSLRPFVSDDGFIRLELRPQISDGETTPVGDFVIPNETTNELTTNVIVRNGQTVVLGGLFKEDTVVTRRQVPLAGDIPIIGAAFKGQDDSVDRSEVIFLITPTIVKDQALYAAGERAKDSIELANLGAREGLLPFSRSKLTAAHLRDAMKHLEAGDKDKALWSANMALNLDPTAQEALRLREELTGQRVYWPSRSILKDAVNNMVAEQLKNADAQQPAEPSEPADDSTAQPATETEQASAEQPVEPASAQADAQPATSDEQAGAGEQPTEPDADNADANNADAKVLQAVNEAVEDGQAFEPSVEVPTDSTNE